MVSLWRAFRGDQKTGNGKRMTGIKDSDGMVRGRTKVLVVIRHPTGGIRTYLKYTYAHLDASKYQFTIFTIRDEATEQNEGSLSVRDCEVIRAGKFGFGFAWRLFWDLIRRRPDIIHSQGSSCGVTVSLVNWVTRIPHVITFHETFDEDTFTGRWKGLKKRIVSALFSRADCLNVVG